MIWSDVLLATLLSNAKIATTVFTLRICKIVMIVGLALVAYDVPTVSDVQILSLKVII